jgi:hypothetical protein
MLHGLPGVLDGVDHRFIQEHGFGYTVLITAELQDGKLACVARESV